MKAQKNREAQALPARAGRGLTRRRLLAGGVVAAPTLALLHETIPHQGVHEALAGDGASAATAHDAHGGAHVNAAGTAGPTFRAGETVDHRAALVLFLTGLLVSV